MFKQNISFILSVFPSHAGDNACYLLIIYHRADCLMAEKKIILILIFEVCMRLNCGNFKIKFILNEHCKRMIRQSQDKVLKGILICKLKFRNWGETLQTVVILSLPLKMNCW